MGACWTTGAQNKCAMLLSKGGGALGSGRMKGEGGGVFQFVSHYVETDVDGKMNAKTEGTIQESTVKCEANVTHSIAPSHMSCFWI